MFNEFLATFCIILLIVDLTYLIYWKMNTTTLTDFFVLYRGKIQQKINKDGRKLICSYHKKTKFLTTYKKNQVFAHLLKNNLLLLILKLQPGITYKATTHFVTQMKHLEKRGVIKIIVEKEKNSRLLIEALFYRGLFDFTKQLLNKKLRKRLFRKFHSFEFQKVS